MGNVELTSSQRRVVTALVNEHQQSGAPVKAARIAALIDRNPGSVRNQMQSLKSVGVVEGTAGPQGGYAPTETAYAVLGREDLDDHESVTLTQDYERVDVVVDEIDLPNVTHPDECTAHVSFQESAPEIGVGDPILVGPTPVNRLVVGGPVEAVNETATEVFITVTTLEAPLSAE